MGWTVYGVLIQFLFWIPLTIMFFRIVLPQVRPAIMAGTGRAAELREKRAGKRREPGLAALPAGLADLDGARDDAGVDLQDEESCQAEHRCQPACRVPRSPPAHQRTSEQSTRHECVSRDHERAGRHRGDAEHGARNVESPT